MTPPKKHFVPFLFLLVFCILLLLYSPHPNYISTPTTLPLYPNSATVAVAAPTFSLIIKVLTFNRLNSLTRCLTSLSKAHYDPNHPVHLHIFIDHFRNQTESDPDPKLEESIGILRFVEGFKWKWGEKMVHYRTTNVGLQAQWLEAWWPSSDDEFAFVVEDDLELSPLFFKYLKALILNYYYNASNFSPFVYGASLQRPRFVPGKHGNKMLLESTSGLFFYQLVGTWGQLLFPKPWKEFRLWYDYHKAKDIKPFLDGMVTTGWYKKMGERIWTPWFIKFIHYRGYFNIYTKFSDEKSLSVSHRDVGVNYGKTAGPDSQLLDANSLDSHFPEIKSLSTMKWYDFCFREVVPGRIVGNVGYSNDLESILRSVQAKETVLLVSLFGVSESITRNLICHLERLNIWNYVFIGPGTDFLFDLARRGHPVIDADRFFNNIRSFKSLKIQDSNARFTKEILLKAYVVKKSLQLSYNIWVLDGNKVFVDNNPFLDPNDNFYVGESMDFFYVKTSPSARKIWTDDFLYDVAAMVDKIELPRDAVGFASIMAKLMEQKGIAFKHIDEKRFGMKIGNQNRNQTLETDKKIVYWFKELDTDTVQKQLQEMNLWVIDNDSSCRAVVCHES